MLMSSIRTVVLCMHHLLPACPIEARLKQELVR